MKSNTINMINPYKLKIGDTLEGQKAGVWKPFTVTEYQLDQLRREYDGEIHPNCPRGIDNVRLPEEIKINLNVGFVNG